MGLGGAKNESRPSTSGQALGEDGGGSREAGFRADWVLCGRKRGCSQRASGWSKFMEVRLSHWEGLRLEGIAGFASGSFEMPEDSIP